MTRSARSYQTSVLERQVLWNLTVDDFAHGRDQRRPAAPRSSFKRVEAHGTADFQIISTSAYRERAGESAVVVHDDPYTTMEYVVDTLFEHFTGDRERAKALMLEIHETGRSVVAVLSYEEATAKAASVIERAEGAGHPLRVTIEPALAPSESIGTP